MKQSAIAVTKRLRVVVEAKDSFRQSRLTVPPTRNYGISVYRGSRCALEAVIMDKFDDGQINLRRTIFPTYLECLFGEFEEPGREGRTRIFLFS